MYSRLQRELSEFLIQYDISEDTNIFEKALMKFIGIKEENKHSTFRFSNRWGSDTDISLSTPSLLLEDLLLVLDYFKVPLDKYKTNEEILLNTEVLFDAILPQFKSHIDSLAKLNPEELKPYQIKSKEKLERNAIEKIESLIRKLLKFVNNDEIIPIENKQLSRLLFQIKGILSNIQSESKFYFYIASAYSDLKHFLDENLELKNSIDTQQLTDLYHQLEVYIKYNRAESVLSINRVMNELDDLLLPYSIDKKECDIFEQYLLNLAGVTQYPYNSKYKGGYMDKSKMNFIMLGINEDDAKKFQSWIKANGDEGATLSMHKVEASEAMQSNKERPQSAVIRENPTYVTRYEFQIDGEALHKKIFPLFKEKFISIVKDDLTQLKPYQELSKNSEVLKKYAVDQNAVKVDSAVSFNHPATLFHQRNEAQIAPQPVLISDTLQDQAVVNVPGPRF